MKGTHSLLTFTKNPTVLGVFLYIKVYDKKMVVVVEGSFKAQSKRKNGPRI